MNDITLVTQVAVFGNRRAFDSLLRKYQSQVRRFLLSLTLGDGQLADDLAQDTFIKAYTCLHQFQARSRFSTWLFRIAYNVFYDYTRRQHPVADVDGVEAMSKSSPIADDTERMDIYHALALLSENERTCITLQIIEGEPIDRIVEITGMAQGTVKSHLFRGKQKLSTFLRQNGYEK